MNTFVRAVISGFGFSLGSAVYKRVSKKLGFTDEKDEEETSSSKTDPDAAVAPEDDPSVQGSSHRAGR